VTRALIAATWADEFSRWMTTNAGRRISFYEVATLFREAYEKKTSTIAKAPSGFRCTGIWPFKPDVFGETEFLHNTGVVQEGCLQEGCTEQTARQKVITTVQMQVVPQY